MERHTSVTQTFRGSNFTRGRVLIVVSDIVFIAVDYVSKPPSTRIIFYAQPTLNPPSSSGT